MDDAKQYKVIEDILIAADIDSREELMKRYDKGGGVIGLKQIGRKRRKLLGRTLHGTDEEWAAAFPHIPLYGATLPIELSPVEGARVEWTPADALLEGAGGYSLDVPGKA